MQIFAVYLYEAIEEKYGFYKEITNLMEFLEKNFDFLKFFQKHFSDHKNLEIVVRRLLHMVQITDPLGNKMFILAVKVYRPNNLTNFLDILKVTYEDNFK